MMVFILGFMNRFLHQESLVFLLVIFFDFAISQITQFGLVLFM